MFDLWLMNGNPKSKWSRPFTGKSRWLAWLALFAVLALVLFGVLSIGANQQSGAGELTLVAVLVAGVGLLIVFALIRLVRWLCCGRNFRRFLFGAACFVTLILLAYAVENWRGQRAWSKHRSEWEAKGEKFSIAELAPRPVPEEQNFALTPLLRPALEYTHTTNGIVWRDTNALARLDGLKAELLPDRDTNNKLVLGSVDKGTFADLVAWREFYRGNTNYPQPAVPGTAAEDILFALGKFDPELKELREAAAARPFARYPVAYEYEPPWAILLPHLARMKGLTVLTHVRATAALETDRSAEALADWKLGWRISDSIHEEPILIDHLVRIATLGINLQTVREGLVRHAWTEPQLEELEKHLANANLLAEYKLAQRGERALSTGGLDWLRRQGSRTDAFNYLASDEGGAGFVPVSWAIPSGWIRQNMLTISEMHQEFTLAAVDEHARRVFPDVCDKLETTVEKMGVRPYTIFAKLLMPALGKAVRRSARMQTSLDAARIAIALERHRLANGALPENLDPLAPRYLARLPTDLMDGKPLRYRRGEAGGYILYSVGWNQTDEGGEIAWTKGKDPNPDLSKGDWVWQMPAK